ncbi:MAG: uroporphyrinogen-III C-methyltransferase [Deltaproteobacteria bacterium]|nr:uroporphyrinogen-III C-methyltransferase [Deltaproteobacteria bacterium]
MSQSRVYLVGAGPGDPELITLKGKRVLEEAEVVIYDRLVGDGVLEFVNPQAELVFVGKESSNHSRAQEEINRLIATHAKRGKKVVRLKGGDPYIFGRGGEEASYLFNESIPFEVIPGVTAASGVAAYAGIPLTDRRYSSAVTFITGHRMKGEGIDNLNWGALAELNHTIVFYMGVANISEITRKLTENGRSSMTPAAIVSRGTTPEQKTVLGTLSNISKKAFENNVKPPALLVVGEVVNLSAVLNWFEESGNALEDEPLEAVSFRMVTEKAPAFG